MILLINRDIFLERDEQAYLIYSNIPYNIRTRVLKKNFKPNFPLLFFDLFIRRCQSADKISFVYSYF